MKIMNGISNIINFYADYIFKKILNYYKYEIS